LEYFLGSLITLAIVFVLGRAIRNNPVVDKRLRYSQSHIYSLASNHVKALHEIVFLETQATKHFLNSTKELRVVLHDGDAYWILNNTLFTAKLNGNEIDRDSTKVVDTMTIDKVELNKLMIIVEKLTEGKTGNDNRNPGNQGFF
jgi:hypothetical protein